jgi:hypothetical protein
MDGAKKMRYDKMDDEQVPEQEQFDVEVHVGDRVIRVGVFG